MTVRQGFMIDGACDRPLADAVAFAADRGFDFVELNAEQGYDRRRTDPQRVAGLLDDAGLDLVVHLPYRLDVGSPHEHVREGALRELEASVGFAAALGAVRGVAVVAENVKGDAVDVHDFPDLFARTDAAACLDTGHAHVSGMDAAAQADLLGEHGDRIAHVHLNDTRRDDDEHLPVGLGRVDFAEIVAAMVETDWAGTATHEVFGYDLAYAAAGKERFDDLLAAAR